MTYDDSDPDLIYKDDDFTTTVIDGELTNIIENFINITSTNPDLNGFCELTGITTKPIDDIPVGSEVTVDISDYLDMPTIHYNGLRYKLNFKVSVTVSVACKF